MSATKPASILRLKDLQERIKLSRSGIYAKISAGQFPPPIILGPRAVGWLESDIEQWIKSRLRASALDAMRCPSEDHDGRGSGPLCHRACTTGPTCLPGQTEKISALTMIGAEVEAV